MLEHIVYLTEDSIVVLQASPVRFCDHLGFRLRFPSFVYIGSQINIHSNNFYFIENILVRMFTVFSFRPLVYKTRAVGRTATLDYS
jgi:NhaP-type Na+/H+ or K+/H+ antiporter